VKVAERPPAPKFVQVLAPCGLDCHVNEDPLLPDLVTVIVVPEQTVDVEETVPGVLTTTFRVAVYK
jgi:hypothetical protein